MNITKPVKKKLVVSYKNLSPELLEVVKEKFPSGYSDYVIKVDKGNGTFFHAFTLETDDAVYLVKVDVKIDTQIEEVEKQLFGSSSDDTGGDDFPDSEDDAAFASADDDGDED